MATNYETKAILMSVAKIALLHGERGTYTHIADVLNCEAPTLKSYDEAKKELTKERDGE